MGWQWAGNGLGMGWGWAQARRNPQGRSLLHQQNQQYQQSVPGFNTATPCAEDGRGRPYLGGFAQAAQGLTKGAKAFEPQ